MKSIILLPCFFCFLIFSSFESVKITKTINVKTVKYTIKYSAYLGHQQSVVVGTSATNFPGNINNFTISSNDDVTFYDKKMLNILKKYSL